jgi:hypothetical protein
MAPKRRSRRVAGSIRRLPSGRYQARFRDVDGDLQTAPATFATKAEADLWLSTVATDMSRREWVDATYVLWATCKLVDVDRLPERGIIARIHLADRPKERFWMLLRRPYAEICSSYPDRDEDVIVHTDIETLAHWHLRHLTHAQATRSGRLQIEGVPSIVRTFLGSIRPSPFAGTQPAKAR